MTNQTPDRGELEKILTDTAETICGEWCDGSHEGAEAVKEHLSKERQALLDWRDKAVREARIDELDNYLVAVTMGYGIHEHRQKRLKALNQPEGEKK